MKNILFIGLVLTSLLFVSCEKHDDPIFDQATFENVDLGTEGYWNGSDESGSIIVGNATFINNYNPEYGSWSGFSFSSKTDITTAGYGNMYSAIVGKGANDSDKYAVYYGSSYSPDSISFTTAEKVDNISLTNSTYAYLSMKEGDASAKKFNTADKDWFLLTITARKVDGSIYTKKFYLADFRTGDGYIVNEWTDVDLSDAGYITSLKFSFTSTDNGQWGMNTPAYVCIDDLVGELQ